MSLSPSHPPAGAEDPLLPAPRGSHAAIDMTLGDDCQDCQHKPNQTCQHHRKATRAPDSHQAQTEVKAGQQTRAPDSAADSGGGSGGSDSSGKSAGGFGPRQLAGALVSAASSVMAGIESFFTFFGVYSKLEAARQALENGTLEIPEHLLEEDVDEDEYGSDASLNELEAGEAYEDDEDWSGDEDGYGYEYDRRGDYDEDEDYEDGDGEYDDDDGFDHDFDHDQGDAYDDHFDDHGVHTKQPEPAASALQ